MIGSDFPHPEGTAPNTISMLEARPGLTSQDRAIYSAPPQPISLELETHGSNPRGLRIRLVPAQSGISLPALTRQSWLLCH